MRDKEFTTMYREALRAFAKDRESARLAKETEENALAREQKRQKFLESLYKFCGQRKTDEGRDASNWDFVEHNIRNLVNANRNTTIDWVATMTQLLASYFDFMMAANGSLTGLEADWFSKGISSVIPLFSNYVANPILANDVKVPAALPLLTQGISVDDKGVLQTDFLVADLPDFKFAPGSEACIAVRKAVDNWLDDCGYVPDPNNRGGYISRASGNPLDAKTFADLRDKGLGKQPDLASYLSNELATRMDVQEVPSPRP